ncbi:MAG: 2-hydroxyacid dehydrogenase family protein [Paludibacteraceae bacterium]|nr:2-hydroxyacid dehydrogenase family protein [Paludibacteraceae bacterium]
MKVLVTYNLPKEGFADYTSNFNFIFPENKASFTKEEIISRIGDVEALLSMFNLPIDKEIIDAGKNLKIISNFGVGFNNVDIEYAKSKGIRVTNTPDPVVEPTAELAFTLIGDLARRVSECDKKLRQPNAIRWGVMENLGVGLYKKRLGIIGMGRIGQAIARRALASGMEIVYHNRHQLSAEKENELNIRYLPLNELLAESDFISLNTPLTESTYHMIDKRALKSMKKGCMVINTARGPVVNEADLINALKEGIIGGAALDVFEFEPKISEELLKLENVVLVPHIGTATLSARNEMSRYACENIRRFFNGEDPLSVVV